MCIGWASAVALYSSHTSVAPTAGFSVTGSIHRRLVHTPGATLGSPATVPSRASAGPSWNADISSSRASGRVTVSGGSGVIAGSWRNCGGVEASTSTGGHDPELHDLAGRVGIGGVEVDAGAPAAERLVGSDVGEHVVADRHVGEVDDQVGPLGQAHQQPVAVVGGEVDRGGEEAALVADRPHLDAGDLVEVEDEEPRLAAVEDPEPVAALLDGLERPGVAVDDDHVAEELGVPDRRDVGVGDVRAGEPVEERPGVGVEQRPVVVERAVLDGDGDLPVGLVGRELVVLAGRRPGERRRQSGAASRPRRRRRRVRRG